MGGAERESLEAASGFFGYELELPRSVSPALVCTSQARARGVTVALRNHPDPLTPGPARGGGLNAEGLRPTKECRRLALPGRAVAVGGRGPREAL